MRIQFINQGVRYESDLSAGESIAIELDFDGPQPSHFGADRALRKPLVMGEFIGDTRRGGGCNVDRLELIPHCNGTHTESVGHIVDESIPVGRLATEAFYPAWLISVTPVAGLDCGESYRPDFEPGDRVVAKAALQPFEADLHRDRPQALIIRTLPNEVEKTSRRYGESTAPPFLTIDAIDWIDSMGIQHLLLDLPSVDRMYDEGRLTAHHRFWNVPAGSHALEGETRIDRTITEMVYIPDRIVDQFCLVAIQVASFCNDAAPSRPVLYPVSSLESEANHG